MNRTRVGAATVGALVLAFLLQTVPGQLLRRWVVSDRDGSLVPTFGSAADTSAVYISLAAAVESVAPVGVGVVLGYAVTRHTDDARRSLRTVGFVGVGGIAVLCILAVVGWLSGGASAAASTSEPAVTVVLTFLGAVAGAGLERFDLLGDDGSTDGTADPSAGIDADADAGAR